MEALRGGNAEALPGRNPGLRVSGLQRDLNDWSVGSRRLLLQKIEPLSKPQPHQQRPAFSAAIRPVTGRTALPHLFYLIPPLPFFLAP